uniref:Bm12986 n=1 Tax=Brugia malayi TaxID=6279 RepID=A0A0J9Y6K7_BRUMA|nr:Bm12986 [Brugia malayi]
MSIHAISCRFISKRFGGIVPSTSANIVLSLPSSAIWKNYDNKRNFSNNTYLDIAAELQAHPVIQWFDRSVKASCNYAQSLIETSGLSSTPLEHLEIRSGIGSVILYSSNVGIFFTQYCGIKKMAEVVYPSWTGSGMLSFTDLTVSDPVFLLPTLTAICFTFTTKKWIEILQMQKTVSNWMLGLKPYNTIYPIAACSFFVASNVPSVVCIYWITSSLISNMHATVLRTRTMHSLLHLPAVCSDPAETRRTELLNYVSEMRWKRASETLELQKKVAEIEKKSQDDDLSKLLAKETENTEIQKDSLFGEPWKESAALSSSKIAKLMEQYIQEEARANVMTKAGKTNSMIRTNSRKFEIDEITAG